MSPGLFAGRGRHRRRSWWRAGGLERGTAQVAIAAKRGSGGWCGLLDPVEGGAEGGRGHSRACSPARGVVVDVCRMGAGACEQPAAEVVAAAERGDDGSCGLLEAVGRRRGGEEGASPGLFAGPGVLFVAGGRERAGGSGRPQESSPPLNATAAAPAAVLRPWGGGEEGRRGPPRASSLARGSSSSWAGGSRRAGEAGRKSRRRR